MNDSHKKWVAITIGFTFICIALIALSAKSIAIPRLLEKAKYEHLHGNESKAIKIYEQILRIDANHEYAKVTLAFIHMQRNEANIAERLAKEVIEKYPKNANALAILGWVYMMESDWEKAIEFYSKSIEIEPIMTNAHLDLSEAYRNMGRLDDADRELRKHLQSQPTSHRGYEAMGNRCLQLNDLQGAKENYMSALKLWGGSYSNILKLGKIYRENGDYQSEIALYQEAGKAVRTQPLEEALKKAKMENS